jgi:hypothetical protein
LMGTMGIASGLWALNAPFDGEAAFGIAAPKAMSSSEESQTWRESQAQARCIRNLSGGLGLAGITAFWQPSTLCQTSPLASLAVPIFALEVACFLFQRRRQPEQGARRRTTISRPRDGSSRLIMLNITLILTSLLPSLACLFSYKQGKSAVDGLASCGQLQHRSANIVRYRIIGLVCLFLPHLARALRVLLPRS